MTSAELVRKLRQQFGPDIQSVTERVPGNVHITVAPESVVAVAKSLYRDHGARFLITAGIDSREERGCFDVDHVFSVDRPSSLFVVIRASVTPDKPEVAAITPEVPGAGWAERELQDLLGVRVEGHPDPRRLVLPDDWPEGVHPLRKDVKYGDWPPLGDEDAETRYPWKHAPEGTSTVVVGPFFPVLEEPCQIRLFVDGERVVDCDYRGFYNHRGVEKLGDSMLTYNKIPFLAERICGICGFIHSTCYCEAAEEAMGIKAPRRARYIRSLMLEVERVHSHLLWLGIAGHILGFDTVLMQVWRIREPIMWLCEKITGNRKTYGMNIVGGVRRDVPKEVHPEILEIVDKIEQESVAVLDAIQGDTTLRARLSGVGILPEEKAKEIAVAGPTARGSNWDVDARAEHPYAAYDEVPVRVVTHPDCDNWARVVVRIEEVLEAIRLIRECLKEMPDGPTIVSEIPEEIPAGQWGVCTVEAPRGEAIHYLWTGGDNRPERWRVRAPTYQNLQALPSMIQDETIADVPITLGSMDPCFSCTERVEVVSARSGESQILTYQELLARSRAATERLRGRSRAS
jgi:Ni,Fe-hydrogenase III large subunit/Ni,Fe-hydrogenase III component G